MKNLKQLAAMICLVFVVSLIGNQFVQAQENKQSKENDDGSPSLQETTAWLKSKLESNSVSFKVTAIQKYKNWAGVLTDGTNDHFYDIKFSNINFDGCSLTWSESQKYIFSINGNKGDPSDYTGKTTTKLSELDPLGIKVQQVEPQQIAPATIKSEVIPDTWLVVLKTMNSSSPDFKNIDKFTTALSWHKYDGTNSTYFFGFMFQDREMAKRVTNAFQNAIKKCGGKVEPF